MSQNLRDRTDAKLRYAEVMLVEIQSIVRKGGDDFEKSHFEAFLFHLVGVFDSLLAEFNLYYGCGLRPRDISARRLRDVLKKRPSGEAVALAELAGIESRLQNHLRVMRNHST